MLMELFLTSFVFFGASPQPNANAPEDLATIRRIEERVQPVIDINDVINYYAVDAMTLDHSSPGLYRGRQMIRDSFATQLHSTVSLKLGIDEINIASDGELACAAMHLQFEARKRDGTTLLASTRSFDAFRKIDGKWQIVQQHISLPFTNEGKAMRQASITPGEPLFQNSPFEAGAAVGKEQAERELAAWTKENFTSTDPARQAALYAPTSLLYDVTYPGVVRDRSAMGARAAEDSRRAQGSNAKPPLVETITNGRFAVQISSREAPPGFGEIGARPSVLRQSNCLVRKDGEWQSVLEMRSYVVDRATQTFAAPPTGALDQKAAVPASHGEAFPSWYNAKKK